MISQNFLWIALLYFFSGLPLGFFYNFLPVILRQEGVDLVKIGLISSAGIFWSLKPLWAPLIDRYRYKSQWISLSLFGLSLTLFLIYLTPFKATFFFSLLFLLTFFSALLDSALDGFFIEYVPRVIHGQANGIRLASYRIALIFSGGLLVAFSEFFQYRFLLLFLSLLCVTFGLIVFLKKDLRIRGKRRKEFNLIDQYINPIKDLLQRERGPWILLFVASYKIGDALLGGMVNPFWVDKGFSPIEIGFILGTLGVIFTIFGSLLGGYFIKKIGIKKALIGMGLLQSLSNLGYTIVAYPGIEKSLIYGASILESFSGGLGTSAFLTFLTLLCQERFSASQYAILSTLFSLTLVFSRTISGLGAKSLGYFSFFGLTFFIGLLPLLLIPLIIKDENYLFKR